ncbi:trace amine-associated receptor 13c-like [Hoplias malabaricus]|uniref:trace amine-associated receptor 13c-like n=1 Tax=Hoplias malabaricus TaxID=27720 RepID=UPI003461DADF
MTNRQDAASTDSYFRRLGEVQASIIRAMVASRTSEEPNYGQKDCYSGSCRLQLLPGAIPIPKPEESTRESSSCASGSRRSRRKKPFVSVPVPVTVFVSVPVNVLVPVPLSSPVQYPVSPFQSMFQPPVLSHVQSPINIMEHHQNITVQYCFPDNNSSCIKEVRGGPSYTFLFIVLSCISVCTVFLNLLVIISISHFKKLHTPTNLLIVSLAVADLLVGLIVMPVKIMELSDSCWYLGKLGCYIYPIINFLSLCASLCSLTFIAVDRYIAISDPLHYSIRITVCKMSVLIITGWSFSLFYVIIFLYFNDNFIQSQVRCYGECVLFIKHSWVITDLVLFFITPCSIIIILYTIILKIARHQAKAVRAVTNGTSKKQGDKLSNSSETKAAKTLGIVIFVYLACWIPIYLSSMSVENLTTVSVVWTVFGWMMYINSSVNPLIYAIFYSWFRESVKYILSCRIFESSSSRINLFPERL